MSGAGRVLSRLTDRLVNRWLRACEHDDRHVAADILAGGDPGTEVKYCRRCGAVRIDYAASGRPGDWRKPEPLWFPRGEGMR